MRTDTEELAAVTAELEKVPLRTRPLARADARCHWCSIPIVATDVPAIEHRGHRYHPPCVRARENTLRAKGWRP